MRQSIFIAVITGLLTLPALAEPVQLERPIRVTARTTDGERVDGMVSAFDENGFEIAANRQGPTETVRWDDLPADDVFNVHARLLRDAPAERWVEVGERLLARPDGKGAAEKAFRRAASLDPGAKALVDQARVSAATRPGPTASAAPSPRATGAQPTVPAEGEEGEGTVAQQPVGQIDPSAWGELTDEQHQQAIDELVEFADRTRAEINDKLVLSETEYFLFYTDMRPNETAKYVRLLDDMYHRLAELFDVPAGTNIFKGKALVFVFQYEDDYRNFQRVMHNTDAGTTIGMCHAFGNGLVHIAFHRQPNELEFEHVLVHESVHGFLHRYRSPHRIPFWLNEGLAEMIAGELVPNRGKAQVTHQRARDALRRVGGTGNLFDKRPEGWQYPIARRLSEFMTERNVDGYVAMIDGIKEGMDWNTALQERYGTTVEDLVTEFGEWMGVEGIVP